MDNLNPEITAVIVTTVKDKRSNGHSELVVLGDSQGITLRISATEYSEDKAPWDLYLTHSQFDAICKLRMCKVG